MNSKEAKFIRKFCKYHPEVPYKEFKKQVYPLLTKREKERMKELIKENENRSKYGRS